MYYLCIGWSIPSVFIIILVAAILEQGDIKPLYIVMVFFFVLVSVIIFWWWNIKNINHFSVSEFLYECVPVVWMSFIISFSIKPLILAGGNRGSLLCSNSHVYNIFKQRMMPIHELFGVNFKTKIMWLAQQKWFVTL